MSKQLIPLRCDNCGNATLLPLDRVEPWERDAAEIVTDGCNLDLCELEMHGSKGGSVAYDREGRSIDPVPHG